MTDATSGDRMIEVAEDVYDVLQRTADSRDTDVNGALRHLIEVPTPCAVADHEV